MVANTVRRHTAADGLRPLSLVRDWRPVLDLIEVAFGENLDAEARRALRGMRPPPLLAPLIALADNLAPPGEGMMPGFVWVEGGKVIGTASARRAQPLHGSWLISNVAVHPDRQGRGIGRALLEAALDFAADYGGTRAILQMRGDNLAARRLYESLGFREIGQVVRWQWTTIETPTPASRVRLRPARWSEGGALFRLARTLTPSDMFWIDTTRRTLYQTGPLKRLTDWLRGQHSHWWVRDEPHRPFDAAVAVEVDKRNPWHRLRLLISPAAREEALALELIVFGLAQLAQARPLPVEIEHPADDAATRSALTAAGFEPLYSMIHMRLDLR